MKKLPENSVDAIVTDPPYGLEFMGAEWDAPWQASSKSALFGDRATAMPGWGSTRNANCRSCGGRLRGANRCSCAIPDWDEAPNTTMLRQMVAFGQWCSEWATECLRVLKPGGHLLAFGGTRTSHRMVCAIEDVGFEIRDSVQWIHGQGFPKSLNIGKAIDKAAGAEREVVGYDASRARPNRKYDGGALGNIGGTGTPSDRTDNGATITAPATDAAKQWTGWGTALKPAHEPIVLARKPLSEGTVAANILKWGTGGLNIDDTRIKTNPEVDDPRLGGAGDWSSDKMAKNVYEGGYRGERVGSSPLGRFPSNFIISHLPECKRVGTKRIDSTPAHPLNGTTESPSGYGTITQRSGEPGNYGDADGKETVDDWGCADGCPVTALNEQSGVLPGMWGKKRTAGLDIDNKVYGKGWKTTTQNDGTGDSGGASRFFFNADWELENASFQYCPKASRSEREAGLEGMTTTDEHKTTGKGLGNCIRKCPEHGESIPSGQNNYACGCAIQHEGAGDRHPISNFHPTVKSLSIMAYLIKLVTREGYIVLDPFLGSGTTIIAAQRSGRIGLGFEQSPEYAAIARARIAYWSKGGTAKSVARKVAPRPPASPPKRLNTLDAYLDAGEKQ